MSAVKYENVGLTGPILRGSTAPKSAGTESVTTIVRGSMATAWASRVPTWGKSFDATADGLCVAVGSDAAMASELDTTPPP